MKNYNFGANQARLFPEVQQKLIDAISQNAIDHALPIHEIYHRDTWFFELLEKTKTNLTTLLDIPKDHEVLFCHGGASLQFHQIPMTFASIRPNTKAYYLTNGYWSRRAMSSATPHVLTQEISSFEEVPQNDESQHDYVFYTSNETIEGLYNAPPQKQLPAHLVCDMTSDILSAPINVNPYTLIFASAQKNISLSGLTLIIAHSSFIQSIPNHCPTIAPHFNLKELQKNNSLSSTPNSIALYTAYLTTSHLLSTFHNLETLHKVNQQKAQMLYDFIDEKSPFFSNTLPPQQRSITNVTFSLPSVPLEEKLCAVASDNGYHQIKGHRHKGGIRVSLYNSITPQQVQNLVDFLNDFQQKHR